jgi:hypothetical protein
MAWRALARVSMSSRRPSGGCAGAAGQGLDLPAGALGRGGAAEHRARKRAAEKEGAQAHGSVPGRVVVDRRGLVEAATEAAGLGLAPPDRGSSYHRCVGMLFLGTNWAGCGSGAARTRVGAGCVLRAAVGAAAVVCVSGVSTSVGELLAPRQRGPHHENRRKVHVPKLSHLLVLSVQCCEPVATGPYCFSTSPPALRMRAMSASVFLGSAR